MKAVDLSHTLHSGMPVYPGTMPPVFKACSDILRDGYLETDMHLWSHTGTHLDAPAHLLPHGETLEGMDLDRFAGKGCVLDMTQVRGRNIEVNDLKPHSGLISDSKFVLIQTGWSKFWGRDEYLQAYPAINPEAARWLAETGIMGLGLDTISPDPLDAPGLPAHHELLERGCLIIENLTHLGKLPAQGFTFLCLPLKLENGDGSPLRAAALLP